MTQLRRIPGWFWEVSVLATLAALAFWLEQPTAGWALSAAATVRGLDGNSQRTKEMRAFSDAVRRDRSETRRLLYAALIASSGGTQCSPEIAGTLANALAHHSKSLSEADAEQLGRIALSGTMSSEANLAKIRHEIERLTSLLKDPAPETST